MRKSSSNNLFCFISFKFGNTDRRCLVYTEGCLRTPRCKCKHEKNLNGERELPENGKVGYWDNCSVHVVGSDPLPVQTDAPTLDGGTTKNQIIVKDNEPWQWLVGEISLNCCKTGFCNTLSYKVALLNVYLGSQSLCSHPITMALSKISSSWNCLSM